MGSKNGSFLFFPMLATMLCMHMASDTSFTQIATTIFLVLNATGQIPLFLALLGQFDQKRQIRIIVRELSIALLILWLFTFFGDTVLDLIGITRPIIGIAGGTLLVLISLTMIFPKPAADPTAPLKTEPMIIPLAIPVITGPGAISTVMTFAHETGAPLMVAAAGFCAWLPSLGILLAGSYIKKILGDKGLVAVERLGGMLVCLIGMQMLTSSLLDRVRDYFSIAVR
ncbi:MAG: hypothetical protein RL235_749 [Chlamydiota bacterium]|jgi:multiple antibiotic resistance protein